MFTAAKRLLQVSFRSSFNCVWFERHLNPRHKKKENSSSSTGPLWTMRLDLITGSKAVFTGNYLKRRVSQGNRGFSHCGQTCETSSAATWGNDDLIASFKHSWRLIGWCEASNFVHYKTAQRGGATNRNILLLYSQIGTHRKRCLHFSNYVKIFWKQNNCTSACMNFHFTFASSKRTKKIQQKKDSMA